MNRPAPAAQTPLTFADLAGALKDGQAAALNAVNDTIVEHVASGVPLIGEVARHLIGAGGKRLRPLLTLAAADLSGQRDERATLLAAAVELIHAATLLHDDVVDESALRRGLKTANIVFGNKESVLVGDFLFARSFELMVKTGSLTVLDILSRASCTISEGEVLQLTTQSEMATSEDTYLRVIDAKTAALFAAATEAGGIVGGADEAQVAALETFGRAFGTAYQMVDDSLDYAASSGRIGKTVGDDFREGKMTLPVILAMANARTDDEKAFWERTIARREQTAGDFERAQDLMARDGIVDQSLTKASQYADEAASALQRAFAPSPLRNLLEDLALSSVARAT